MQITTIRLSDVLPEVFYSSDAPHGHSEVWNTSLLLRRGTNYRIDATSGAGKSSLCSFLMGTRNDYRGNIYFDDNDVSAFRLERWCELRCNSLAYLPQELGLFPELSAIDNVLVKNKLTDRYSEGEIRKMFEELGIENRIDTPIGRMSVGQRQRVAIIRAICQPFDFLLLDEPVSHLDRQNNEIASRLVADAAAKQNASVIFTSVGNPLLLPLPYKTINL